MAIEKVVLAEGLDGFYALPKGTGQFSVIVLFTEAFGLNEDMLEGSAQKLADAGFAVIAPDIFHGDIFDGSSFEPIMAKIKTIVDETVIEEARQTVAWIKTRPELDADRVGGIGFCMGGRLAFLAHSELADDFKATAAYYGGGIAPVEDRLGRKPLLDKVDAMKGALYLGYGADDQGITHEEHAKIVARLSEAKKRFEFQLFTGAGHAFLSQSRPNYCPEAAAEAWPVTFQFFERHLGR